MENVLDWILSYCKKHQITVDFQEKYPTCSIVESEYILINTQQIKKEQYPFAIAHEIGHINSEDSGTYYFASVFNTYSEEHDADVFGVKLLYRYCEDNDICIDNPQTFIDQFGIPQSLLRAARKVINKGGIRQLDN